MGYLRNGECYSFQTCAIVFSTPENLLVKISGALWTTESHSRVSQKQWMLELWNLCHCVQHPWKLTNKDFWSSRNDRKSLSKQKLWGISEMVNATAFKPVPLCSAPLKTLVEISGALWTSESHFLLKHVFQKCSRVSQKQWMLELWNLCHCVQHPWKLPRKISGALGMTGSHFLSRNVFWENAVGYLRNGECYSFQTKAIVFSIPENLLVNISGALWTTDSHFLSINVFWNSEC